MLIRKARTQVTERAVVQIVDHAMHRDLIACGPGFAQHLGRADIVDLLDNVQFAQTVLSGFAGAQGCKNLGMFGLYFADMVQPWIHKPVRVGRHRRQHPTAAIVATNDNVTDPQRPNTKMKDGQGVQITRRHDIGDVAMDKDIARVQIQQFGCRHAAVGATRPQTGRRLGLRTTGKICRIALDLTCRPAPVAGEDIIEIQRLDRHVAQGVWPRGLWPE